MVLFQEVMTPSRKRVRVLRSRGRPTYIVLIWAGCSELGPQHWDRHRSSEGPGGPPSEAVPGDRGGLQVVGVGAGEASLVVAGDSGDLGGRGQRSSIKFVMFTF